MPNKIPSSVHVIQSSGLASAEVSCFGQVDTQIPP